MNSNSSYYIRMEGFAEEFLRNFSSYDFELIFRRELEIQVNSDFWTEIWICTEIFRKLAQKYENVQNKS